MFPFKELNAHENNGIKVIKDAAARINISRHLYIAIIGNFGTTETNLIHDELHTHCLILDDGDTKLIYIVVDLLGLNQNLIDVINRIIFKKTNIPRKNILISAFHNHSETSTQSIGNVRNSWNMNEYFDEYIKLIINNLTDAIRIEIADLKSAKIGWGVGIISDYVYFRKWKMKSPVLGPLGEYDKVVMNADYANTNKLKLKSETDSDLSFLSIKSIEGKHIAMFVNCSLHYVGGVPKGHIYGENFVDFADRVQELLVTDAQQAAFVEILSNSTLADVSSNNYDAPTEKKTSY